MRFESMLTAVSFVYQVFSCEQLLDCIVESFHEDNPSFYEPSGEENSEDSHHHRYNSTDSSHKVVLQAPVPAALHVERKSTLVDDEIEEWLLVSRSPGLSASDTELPLGDDFSPDADW